MVKVVLARTEKTKERHGIVPWAAVDRDLSTIIILPSADLFYITLFNLPDQSSYLSIKVSPRIDHISEIDNGQIYSICNIVVSHFKVNMLFFEEKTTTLGVLASMVKLQKQLMR